MKWKPGMTIGETYDYAMTVKTKEEADHYFKELVDHVMQECIDEGAPQTREEVIRIQKMNLGYIAGYYDKETMERVNRLFDTEHPIFGKAEVTASEAFEMGRAIGGKHGTSKS